MENICPNPHGGSRLETRNLQGPNFHPPFWPKSNSPRIQVPNRGGGLQTVSHLRFASLKAHPIFPPQNLRAVNANRGSPEQVRIASEESEADLFHTEKAHRASPTHRTDSGKGKRWRASGLNHKRWIFPAPHRPRGSPREAEAFISATGPEAKKARSPLVLSPASPRAPSLAAFRLLLRLGVGETTWATLLGAAFLPGSWLVAAKSGSLPWLGGRMVISGQGTG